MLKRVFAVITAADFYKFLQRSKIDGFDNIGQALAALVHAYAKGEINSLANYKDHYGLINDSDVANDTKPRLSEVQGE